MKVGQRVLHKTTTASFGTGTVVRVKTGKTVDVQWDTHRIKVPYGGFSNNVSGVHVKSLVVLR
jgi:methyl coenzyme M reductase subunit C-like uncharacterized protein (methanogenesis marker protein 7)